jgi:Domain of unknown function (DUF4150)/GHH signature containing HNH/Endo VII superfamily nuclease toxin  2
MANDVFANGREISCKSGSGKTICATPDVCFTPPENPATPPGVPVPYPNTGMASDTTSGSKKVKISGKEIMLKNKSYFKKSIGDEAGCAAKKGVVTSVNRGKVYFIAWSMDVKVESENAVRHLDMTTHNHASPLANSPPWSHIDTANITDEDCKTKTQEALDCMEKHAKQNAHKTRRREHAKPEATKVSAESVDANVDWDALINSAEGDEWFNKTGAQESYCADEKCGAKEGMECNLVPFDQYCCGAKPPHDVKTFHHVVPAHCFMPVGARGTEVKPYDHVKDYDDTKAPCVCLDGKTKSDSGADGKKKQHGRVHDVLDKAEADAMEHTPAETPTGKPKMRRGERVIDSTAGTWKFEDANEKGCDAVSQVTGCDKECMKQQCAAAHKNMEKNIGPDTPLRADPHGKAPPDFVPGGATPATPAPSLP